MTAKRECSAIDEGESLWLKQNWKKLMHAPFCADILIGQVGAGGMVALL